MYKIVMHYKEDANKISEYHARTRQLMAESLLYTRGLISSILSGSTESAEILKRLDSTQDQIVSELILPYSYLPPGNSIVIADLMKKHNAIIKDLATAAKNKTDVTPIKAQLDTNAAEITKELAKISQWALPTTTLLPILTTYDTALMNSIMYRVANDWANDIGQTDIASSSIADYADVLSHGVIANNLGAFSI